MVRRRRRLLIALIVLALVVAGVAAAVPVAGGWTNEPFYTRQVALEQVDAARHAGAARWARDPMHAAELALAEGLEEYRRQESRFYFLRNFDEARIWLRRAASHAASAATEAASARAAAETASVSAIEVAATALADAETLAESVRLRSTERRHLQRARAALGEARALHAQGELGTARELAERAAAEAEEACRASVRLAARFVDGREVQRWRRWVHETVEWSRRTGQPAIVVHKEKNLLTLYEDGRPIRSYAADMGQNKLAPKLRAGDNATPEGRYHIVSKKGAGQSRYYKALLLNYPNGDDRRRLEEARRKGHVSKRAAPGGLIEIHGEGGRGEDWTNGCVALSNAQMDHLFARVDIGTPVTIVGGDGRDGVFSNMVRSNGPRTMSATR